MPAANPIREQLEKEIQQIPDAKLAAFLDIVHYFRIGVQMARLSDHQAGSASTSGGDDLLNELRACIRQLNDAPLGEFRLNLNGYRFDREEANER
jgi:hypothetical protein